MREVRTNDIYESMRKGVKKPRLRVESERIGHFVRCVRLLPPDDREGRSAYVTLENLEHERGFSFVDRWEPKE